MGLQEPMVLTGWLQSIPTDVRCEPLNSYRALVGRSSSGAAWLGGCGLRAFDQQTVAAAFKKVCWTVGLYVWRWLTASHAGYR